MRLCSTDAERCFTAQALLVQAAFSDNHECGALDFLIQVKQTSNDCDTGLDAGGENSNGRISDSTPGAGRYGIGSCSGTTLAHVPERIPAKGVRHTMVARP